MIEPTTETHEQFLERWRVLRAAFDDSPRFTGEAEPGTFDFAAAVFALKAGHHVARESWPGERFVMRQAGYPDGIPINGNTADATGFPQGTICAFTPYLMLCVGVLARPIFTPWQATGEDVLAEDWRIVPRPDAGG
jgi:hypothetical protein